MTHVILITRIPLIERIAPLGASVDKMALVFFNMDTAISASCNFPEPERFCSIGKNYKYIMITCIHAL